MTNHIHKTDAPHLAQQCAASLSSNGTELYKPRSRRAFNWMMGLYWLRTWHGGILRHNGVYRKRPEIINDADHASEILSGLGELLKLVIGSNYFHPSIDGTQSSWFANFYEWWRTFCSVDRVHMHVHDLTSELDPLFVRTKASCPICVMPKVFNTIIRSNMPKIWEHPMTWQRKVSGKRSGLFLIGLLRAAYQHGDYWGFSKQDSIRFKSCYEFIVHLFYLVQSDAEYRLTGTISVDAYQFQRELEATLDSTEQHPDVFALLGFGGNNILQLRNLRDPQVVEEIMERNRIIMQQSANTITNDYSQNVQQGIIGSGEVHVYGATQNMNKQRKKDSSSSNGPNPPNQFVKDKVRRILEENPDGLSAAALFSELQQHKIDIPTWVKEDTDIRSYISSFIKALRDDMQKEGKTIISRPYRISALEQESDNGEE